MRFEKIAKYCLLATIGLISLPAAAQYGMWRCHALDRNGYSWFSPPLYDIDDAVQAAYAKCWLQSAFPGTCSVHYYRCYRVFWQAPPPNWVCTARDLTKTSYFGRGYYEYRVQRIAMGNCRDHSAFPSSCYRYRCRRLK